MTRLARANQLKVDPFYAQYFGRNRSIWNRDIDGLAPEWLMDGLAAWTRQEKHEVEQTTLRSFDGVLYEHDNPHGNTRWILPAGVYHRTRRRHWLVYCPRCLFEDKEPFFRKSWRLAFNTICERHGSRMLDACPQCEAPVVYFRRDLGRRSVAMVDSLALCHRCGFDLRHAPALDPPAPDGKTLLQLRSLITFHEVGWWFNGGTTLNYGVAYFDVLRHLMSFLQNRFGNRLLEQAEKLMTWPVRQYMASSRLEFEHRPIEERHRMLLAGLWLLQDWPDRFVALCKNAKLTRSRIVQEARLPYWFESVLREHLDRSFYQPSEEEIQHAVAHLAREDAIVSRSAINRLTGGKDAEASRPYAYRRLTTYSDEECDRIERGLLDRLKHLQPGGFMNLIVERNLAIVRLMRATKWPLQRVLRLTKKEAIGMIGGSVPEKLDQNAREIALQVLRKYLEEMRGGFMESPLVFPSRGGKKVQACMVDQDFQRLLKGMDS